MMAVSGKLTTVTKLRVLLKLSFSDTDPYANLIVDEASQAIRDYAGQAGWVTLETEDDVLGVGQTLAPPTAQSICLWLSQRAYTNPSNLARRTAGPISDTYFENGVYGLELTDDEKGRLDGLDGGGNGGLWVQPLSSGEQTGPVLIPSSRTPPGDPFYIADGWQFPYGRP